jgi:Alcohol dehydrogenase GroES-like domain
MAGANGMRSYKLTQFGAPLSEVIESPPAPKGAQVLLRVSACGVCHSDLHVADGYFDLGNGQKLDLAPAVKLPRILGHEIAGVVEELGPEATGVKVGDRRTIYAWGGCGSCAQCRAAEENLCAKPRNLSIHADGGFSNYILVDHPRYLVEYEPLSASFAATLGCSGLTAFSALKKAAPVDAQHPLLILGAGGLGLAAVSLCHALYGMGPIVADIDAAKRRRRSKPAPRPSLTQPTPTRGRASSPIRAEYSRRSTSSARRRAPLSACLCCAKAGACSWSACSADRLPFRCPPCQFAASASSACSQGRYPSFGSSWRWRAKARSSRRQLKRDRSRQRSNRWTIFAPDTFMVASC